MKKIVDKKKLARVIATWVVTGIMISVFVLDIITVALGNHYVSQIPVSKEAHERNGTEDRIHFLNTANSDCIILESNGHFAMIDSGEGDNNPRKKTEYEGFSEEVLDYMNSYLADDKGDIHLDFILATHMHYDHSGNFETIIEQDNIYIEMAYIKEYTPEDFSETENNDWGNHNIYLSITDALKKKNVPIISNLPENEFAFEDFTIQFINTTTPSQCKGSSDNNNSVGVLIKKGNDSVFLGADFTNNSGLEDYYANEIGDVDLLKIGHHGYYGSCSADFLRTLKPEITICTNHIGKIYPNVKWNITMIAKAPIFSTAHRNGIMAYLSGDGITLTENIM